MMFSYSRKIFVENKWGTSITPTVQWPGKSITLGLVQALAWKRSGLMVRPTIQFSSCPEVVLGCVPNLYILCKRNSGLIGGGALGAHILLHLHQYQFKWNGNVGTSGIVVRAETPLGRVGKPSVLRSVE